MARRILTAGSIWGFLCLAGGSFADLTVVCGPISCGSFSPSRCHADTLIYLAADGLGHNVSPLSPQNTLRFVPAGGSFSIWIQPDELMTGISLDIQTTGEAIRFTGSTVHNPAVGTTAGSDTRWLPGLIRGGTLTDHGVTRIEAAALATLEGFGRGIGPTTSHSDPYFESSGGFLLATIDFIVPEPTGTAAVTLSIGHNLLSDTSGIAAAPIYLGVGDGPVTVAAGATGSTTDLLLVAQTLLAADFDRDGDVGGGDLLTWQRNFGINDGATRSQGDANFDGRVDHQDFVLWKAQFGTQPAGSIAAAVPEIATVWLAIGAVAISLSASGPRRRRR